MFCQTCGTQMKTDARFCPKCGSGVATAPSSTTAEDAFLGRTIEGRYRIESKLGQGGMGAVYRATRLLIGDTVAFKIMRPETISDPQAVERFRREAQAAARLKHPNVVVIHDFGIVGNDLVYLVMELGEGEDLRHLLDRTGPLTPAVASELMDQVCSALEEAHQRNIVHRDLKPDNILVRTTPKGYQVKVLDFGIAKLRDATTGAGGTLTQVGTVMGTPTYMSPEQCLGSEVDSRSDIYSLGVILYEMLSGSLPFTSREASALVVAHVNDTPPPVRFVNPSIPPGVEAVVMRALEKRRDMRPQTAAAFAQELAAAVRAATTPSAATIAVPTSPSPMATLPVAAIQTDPRAPVVQPTMPEHRPQQGYQQTYPQQTYPQQMPPPPRTSSGVPAVLKVAGALLLLVVGVAVGFLVKYALELGKASPDPPPIVVGPTTEKPKTPPDKPNTNEPGVVLPPTTNTAPPATNTSTPPATARTGTISTSRVTMRDKPSLSGKPKTLLNAGERVEILGEQESTNTREGVLSRDARFAGSGAGDPSTLPSGRGVIIINDTGDEYLVETTHEGRTIRGYVEKAAVSFAARLWYRVRTASGEIGWINSQFVTTSQ